MSSPQPSKVNRSRRNCVEQAWSYFDTAFSTTSGLKVLLCDDATRSILSVAYSQHQLLQHNIVLVDMLANRDRYPMKHFACVIICGFARVDLPGAGGGQLLLLRHLLHLHARRCTCTVAGQRRRH